jgi:Ig-like domain CHU_C associated/Secretion system C-terminal sorting domain
MLKLTTLTLLLLSVFSMPILAQRGKNGSYTVTGANTQINAYTSVTANAAVNATSITVASNTLTSGVLTTALAPGDLIMIIQMQGATMDVDVTPTASWGGHYTVPNGHQLDWGSFQSLWGNVTAYNNAGRYELVEVRSVAGGTTINLMCGLQYAYTASGHVQVVRVPRFVDLTVNTACSIVPTAWNGTTGGVVALEVFGNLTLTGTGMISASGYGFRGGVCETQTMGSPPSAAANKGYCASDDAREGAEKGEGIGGFYTEYDALYSRYCKSAPANGGGGGGNHNAGGGGGSNIGTGAYTGNGIPVSGYNAIWNLESAGFATSTSSGGGRGGYSYSTSNQNESTLGPNNTAWSGDYRRNEGGFGGFPLTYSSSRIFMGGGGGAGDANANPTQGGAGGAGGGIVFMTVYGTISGTGSIVSNGSNGQNANPLGQTAAAASTQRFGNDGAGGAGGGGAIAISNATAIPASITLSANGGTGGNQVISFGGFVGAPTMEADGPGGGGAGGHIAFTSGTPTQSVAGGGNGVTNSGHVNLFPPNGATRGASGMSGLTQTFFNITSPNVTICPNTSATLTASITGVAPGTLTWYSTQFGSTVLGTGATYTTPILSSNATYYVGVCPGTFRLPVTVTVTGAPTISGVLTIPVGGTTTLTGSGTPNGSTPWASGTPAVGTITSGGVVTGISVGTTTITYMNSSGCIVTAIVNVVSPLPVELMYFTAALNDVKKVDLLWATQTEIDNDYFVVQRSTDLYSWEEIALVQGAETSQILHEYRAVDENPLTGTNYYRLKQVDLDGAFKISDIESVIIAGAENVIGYPNPATDVFHIIGHHISDQELVLTNHLGQRIVCETTVVSEDHLQLNTAGLAPGVYYLQVVKDGKNEVLKVTINQH